MDLNPQPTPKMGNYEHCKHCGKCIFGCPQGVKWDSRQFLQDAVTKGAKLITDCQVKKIIIENGKAKGVIAGKRFKLNIFPSRCYHPCCRRIGHPGHSAKFRN